MWSRSPCAIRNGGAPADTQDIRLSSRALSAASAMSATPSSPASKANGSSRASTSVRDPDAARSDWPNQWTTAWTALDWPECPPTSLEPVDPGGQGEQGAQIGSRGGAPDADPLGGQAQARPVPA